MIHNLTSSFQVYVFIRISIGSRYNLIHLLFLSNVRGVRLIKCRIWTLCMAWGFYFISMFPFKFLKYPQNSWLLGFDLSLVLAVDVYSSTTVLLPVPPATSSTRGSYRADRERDLWLTQEATVRIQPIQIPCQILNQGNPSACHMASTHPCGNWE